MPYISQDGRMKFNETLEALPKISNAGELNYLFTKIVLKYIEKKGLNYQTINDIVGALVGCNLEFNRRIVAPYEDKKIAENGDVYEQKP